MSNRPMRFALALCALAPACKSELKSAPPAEAPPAAPPAAPVAPGGLPPGHPPITVQNEAGKGGDLEGRLEVAPAMAAAIKPGDTIFVMARNSATGAMVAVTKLPAPASFPVAFKLGAGNSMLPGGAAMSGSVKLSARVDKDGDPMSKNPGDVVGEVTDPVQLPAKGVVLTLSRPL